MVRDAGGSRRKAMAKVLFVLYVPDDISTTPGITKEPGKDGGKEDSQPSPIHRQSSAVDSFPPVATSLQRLLIFFLVPTLAN